MNDLLKVLKWYKDNGVDDCVNETLVDNFSEKICDKVKDENPDFISKSNSSKNLIDTVKALTQRTNNLSNDVSSNLVKLEDIINSAREAADSAKSLDELRKVVEEFEGCSSIKQIANNTVFGEGNPESDILIIGEAPGNNEDLQGRPFCGEDGKLMDAMFEALGYKRSSLYITNTLFWRPPGNRTPTMEELAMCKPFVEKHIALVRPKLILMMGATVLTNMLSITESITKVRRKFFDYINKYLDYTVKATPLFHPSYLLRQPIKKRDAWKDLLNIKYQIDLL